MGNKTLTPPQCKNWNNLNKKNSDDLLREPPLCGAAGSRRVRIEKTPQLLEEFWWRTRRDSNPQPADSKSDALSIELRVRGEMHYTAEGKLVNFRGLFL